MRFRTLSLILLIASPLAAAPPAPIPHTFSLDDLARAKRVSDPEISPEGGWVAYTVRSVDMKEDKGDTDVWMTSWDGKDSVRLTTSKNSENTPRWSPDGRYLAFLSSRDDENETAQVWLLPRGGGEAEKVTEFKGGVEDLDWSPDGQRLVLVVSDPDPDAADKDKDKGKDKESGKKKTKPPIVIDRFQFKTDESGYLGKERSHLALFDLATRKSETLTTGEADEFLPAWSPDGRTIAFVSKRAADPDRTDVWQIYAIEPRAGANPRQLTSESLSANQPDFGSRLAWSPDSKSIAFILGGPDKLIYYGLHRLAVVPAAGGPVRVLTAQLDRNVQSPRFSADGGSILFTLEEDQAVFLAKIPSAGGKIDRLVSSRGCVSAFSAAGGGKVAILWSSSSKPAEIYALSLASGAQAEPRALTHQNDAWIAELRLAPVEETKFQSKDGTPISGFLVRPVDYVPGKKYPTILRIHGGPVGQFECSLEEEWQWLAANGYAVVAANPRGSSGKGEKFQAAIWADWGHVDMEDVVAAVDDAVARGIADPDRLGVGGWSYGSMLTNYTIASTSRFKAATSGAGSSNALAEYGTDQYIREYEQELGTPWKNLDNYLKVSFPFFHADRITTPTLFLCGDADFNMPLINSEQMYQALRSLGVPTQLVIYPGQHHGLRKPSYVRDRQERYVAWYDRFVKNPGAAGGGAKTAGADR
jgi:dipeptidyl aminopeptidase/acylaminoacyl peptidase